MPDAFILPNTLFDQLPPTAHPLAVFATAAATILLIVGLVMAATLAFAALTRLAYKTLRRPTVIPPRPLLAPWERHALTALRSQLPPDWSVHPHVNPLALLSMIAPAGKLSRSTARSIDACATTVAARHLAATRSIPFTIIGPDNIPRAIIAVTPPKTTRTTRRQDAALSALFRQHGIATILFLTPGTRPDWRAIADTISNSAVSQTPFPLQTPTIRLTSFVINTVISLRTASLRAVTMLCTIIANRASR